MLQVTELGAFQSLARILGLRDLGNEKEDIFAAIYEHLSGRKPPPCILLPSSYPLLQTSVKNRLRLTDCVRRELSSLPENQEDLLKIFQGTELARGEYGTAYLLSVPGTRFSIVLKTARMAPGEYAESSFRELTGSVALSGMVETGLCPGGTILYKFFTTTRSDSSSSISFIQEKAGRGLYRLFGEIMKTSNAIQDWVVLPLIFQIVAVTYALGRVGHFHGDLHMLNTLIQEVPEAMALRYSIAGKTFLCRTRGRMIRLIDMGLSGFNEEESVSDYFELFGIPFRSRIDLVWREGRPLAAHLYRDKLAKESETRKNPILDDLTYFLYLLLLDEALDGERTVKLTVRRMSIEMETFLYQTFLRLRNEEIKDYGLFLAETFGSDNLARHGIDPLILNEKKGNAVYSKQAERDHVFGLRQKDGTVERKQTKEPVERIGITVSFNLDDEDKIKAVKEAVRKHPDVLAFARENGDDEYVRELKARKLID